MARFRSSIYSDEDLIPVVMFAGRNGPATVEPPFEHFEVGNQIHIHPSPIRQWSATRASNLVRKKSCTTFLDAIVMWFDNPSLIAVSEPDDSFASNRRHEQVVQFRFGSLGTGGRMTYAPKFS